jgi:hypothetical protein
VPWGFTSPYTITISRLVAVPSIPAPAALFERRPVLQGVAGRCLGGLRLRNGICEALGAILGLVCRWPGAPTAGLARFTGRSQV